MNYLDSHCHINDESYLEDLDEVLDRMLLNKVNKAMLVCVSLDDYQRTLNIKKEGIEFKKAIGVYPEYTDIDETEFNKYVSLMEKCDAIGEIGLDYHWYKDTRDKQVELFIRQIEIANRLNKPVIIHAREALGDTYNVLKQHPCKAVLHCYSGSYELAKEFIKLGYYISIGGPVTFKNAKEPLEVAKNIPLDRLLIETDSPYLTPVPNRGKRNEPSNVVYTAKKIMEIRGIDEERFLDQINKNYDSLFKI